MYDDSVGPEVYRFREYHIPECMMPGIRRYIDDGVEAGEFLMAVFKNDFMSACGHADEENLKNIVAYMGYLYNEAPSACYGSEKIVKAWIKKGGLNGIEAERQERLADSDPRLDGETI